MFSVVAVPIDPARLNAVGDVVIPRSMSYVRSRIPCVSISPVRITAYFMPVPG